MQCTHHIGQKRGEQIRRVNRKLPALHQVGKERNKGLCSGEGALGCYTDFVS